MHIRFARMRSRVVVYSKGKEIKGGGIANGKVDKAPDGKLERNEGKFRGLANSNTKNYPKKKHSVLEARRKARQAGKSSCLYEFEGA